MKTINPSRFDLFFPGNWIAGDDRDAAFEIQRSLSTVQSEFERAVASWAAYHPIRAGDPNNIDLSKHLRCLRGIYAREFVLSLDTISKVLRTLPETPILPTAVSEAVRDYRATFADLKHIRDSLAHVEDRGRARDRNRQPLNIPVLVIGCFVGDRFEFTGSDGVRYGVEVSPSTLDVAHRILGQIICGFQWER